MDQLKDYMDCMEAIKVMGIKTMPYVCVSSQWDDQLDEIQGGLASARQYIEQVQALYRVGHEAEGLT